MSRRGFDQILGKAEHLLCSTAGIEDPQVRQAREELERALYSVRIRIQEYENLYSQARRLDCEFYL